MATFETELWMPILGVIVISFTLCMGGKYQVIFVDKKINYKTINKWVYVAKKDTTHPSLIDVKPCSVHTTFQNRDTGFLPYEPVRENRVPSLHEFTCRWAVGNELSLDSTHLPRYVRPMEDSLRLRDDVLIYGVKMIEAEDSTPINTLYFVAEVGDSLFYREIQDEYPGRHPSEISVRAIRALDVPGAKSQYIWFETNYYGEDEVDGIKWTTRRWRGYIFTYDKKRGVRFLKHSPIRLEKEKNGTFYGVRQLDVSVPGPGVMVVEERLQRGAKVTKGKGWHQWLGPHVIDTSATDNESFRDPRK
jgi:hypothetical protein